MARGTFDEGGKPAYLHIADGKIVEAVEAGTPGAIERTNKNGKQVWERRDGYVDGIITSMYHKDRTFNGDTSTTLVLRLRDKDEHYQLEVDKGRRYWVAFLTRLPNIDLGKPVRFSPYDFTDKTSGKRIQGMNLFQGDKKIDPKFTKTDPGGLPQGKQVRVNGKDVWDFEARDQYLMRLFDEYVDQMSTGDYALGGSNEDLDSPDSIASGYSSDIGGDKSIMEGPKQPFAPNTEEDESSMPF